MPNKEYNKIKAETFQRAICSHTHTVYMKSGFFKSLYRLSCDERITSKKNKKKDTKKKKRKNTVAFGFAKNH